jgi:hypothetical protein
MMRCIVARTGLHRLRTMMRSGATEDDEVEKRVGSEPVCAMYRDTRRFAHRHKSWNDAFGIAIFQCNDLTREVRRHAAHVVMHGRKYWNRRFGHVDAGKYLGCFRDPR